MTEFHGLSNLRNLSNGVICPKCRNYLEVVNNGIFHGELFYCPKEKLIFNIQLENITKKAGDEFISQCESDVGLGIIRLKITKENMKAVDNYLIESGFKNDG